MHFEKLIHNISEWMKGTGPNADIVVSSRVRLARNLAGIPFAHWAKAEQQLEIVSQVEQVIGECSLFRGAFFVRLGKISELDRQLLVERHLISPEHAEGKGHRAVAVGEQEILSVMLNEEDHLRMQAIRSGFQLMDTWKLIDSVDSELDSLLHFCYSEKWGYLTACPTNIGTGMRASVMVHLPSLVMTKQINKVLQAITKLGLVARGLYGEGTEPSGNFFQVSNQITLGQREEDIIDNIERVVKQIIGHEENARKILLSKEKKQLEDRVFRAYGILSNARVISSGETLNLLSDLRLGIDLGLANQITQRILNELFILIQPAHLQKLEGSELSSIERDIKRGDLIREHLNRRGKTKGK